MLGLYIAKMAICTPLGLLPLLLLPSPRVRVYFYPWVQAYLQKILKKLAYVLVRVYSEAPEIGPLQLYSLGFFSVLDDHRPVGPLLGCQLPTLDLNYRSQVGFESFNVYTPHSDHETMTQCRFNAGPQSTTLVQHWASIGSSPSLRKGNNLITIYQHTVIDLCLLGNKLSFLLNFRARVLHNVSIWANFSWKEQICHF